jgi:hypothetical protein
MIDGGGLIAALGEDLGQRGEDPPALLLAELLARESIWVAGAPLDNIVRCNAPERR